MRRRQPQGGALPRRPRGRLLSQSPTAAPQGKAAINGRPPVHRSSGAHQSSRSSSELPELTRLGEA
eukprot:1021884-Alexandrium_andersonii.AAC.1